jgi:hypothetical protein
VNQTPGPALLLSAAALLAAAPGDSATASYGAGTLALSLRYEMTCGQPGPGPVVVRLPPTFTISRLRVRVDGARRATRQAGTRLTISLPKPPEVTCMSITRGTLRVAVASVRAPAGSYVVRVRVNTHAFAASLRVR